MSPLHCSDFSVSKSPERTKLHRPTDLWKPIPAGDSPFLSLFPCLELPLGHPGRLPPSLPQENVCQLLVEHGAKIDAVNSVKRTPAQMAAFVGNSPCVAGGWVR